MVPEPGGQCSVGNAHHHGEPERVRAVRGGSGSKETSPDWVPGELDSQDVAEHRERAEETPTARINVTSPMPHAVLEKKHTDLTGDRLTLYKWSSPARRAGFSAGEAGLKQLIRSRRKLVPGVETSTEGRRDSSQPGGEESGATDASTRKPRSGHHGTRCARRCVTSVDEEAQGSRNGSLHLQVSVLRGRPGGIGQFSSHGESFRPSEQPQAGLQLGRLGPPRTALPPQAGGLPFPLTRLLLVRWTLGTVSAKLYLARGLQGGGRLPEPTVVSIVTFFAGVFRANKGFQVCQEMPDSKETR